MDRISNEDLKWLLDLLQREGLSEIEVVAGDTEVCVRGASAVPVAAAGVPLTYAPPVGSVVAPPPAAGGAAAPLASDPENCEPLLSPMAGIFYRASSPDSPPYADPGDEVRVGDTIGLIEAMKLYNEVTAHTHGRIVRFLVENEQHVEADQPLVLIERFSF